MRKRPDIRFQIGICSTPFNQSVRIRPDDLDPPQLAVSGAIFARPHPFGAAGALAGERLLFPTRRTGRIRQVAHAALHREIDEETRLKIEIVGLAGWREVLPGTSGGGHYLIMSFAARWVGREPVLNDELDDFKWLAPGGFGDVRFTGGLEEVVATAWRLIRT